MLIDLVVVSALLLFGTFLVFWLFSPALRVRIEHPKHVFLQQVRTHDTGQPGADTEKRDGGNNRD